MELSSIIHTMARDRNCIIRVSQIWDGLSDRLSPAKSIHIRDGLISEVNSIDAPEGGATFIDAENLVVIPALIDSHVHLALDGVDFSSATCRWEQPELLSSHLKASLRAYVSKGILTLRDGGDKALAGLGAALPAK
ncbi:MAG TPA: hypothetical protein VHS59_06395, partial [Bacillota bacterium]|nr:hypothetical protein [Bacillota bacterium]